MDIAEQQPVLISVCLIILPAPVPVSLSLSLTNQPPSMLQWNSKDLTDHLPLEAGGRLRLPLRIFGSYPLYVPRARGRETCSN